MPYKPPFQITPLILQKSQEISRKLGVLLGKRLISIPITLRRAQNIKTIQASLSIEGNTLSVDQVTAIFDGKRVLGPQKDILEAQNAIDVYKNLHTYEPLNIDDFLHAHGTLMSDLVAQAGKWRTGAVGIFKGKEVSHMAPPAKRVEKLMHDLFSFIQKDQTLSWLLKACIFHYELEFIHPFQDGNGRMGRLWQQLLLMKEDPIFEYIPTEVLIKNAQEQYYDVLGKCDAMRESTLFIEFSLQIINQALDDYQESSPPRAFDSSTRMEYAKSQLKNVWFSRKDYMTCITELSLPTASRDLAFGVKQGILLKRGSHNQTRYSFNGGN